MIEFIVQERGQIQFDYVQIGYRRVMAGKEYGDMDCRIAEGGYGSRESLAAKLYDKVNQAWYDGLSPEAQKHHDRNVAAGIARK